MTSTRPGRFDPQLVDAAKELLGADVQPLEGGYSGETFLVGAAGSQAVLRLYLRHPERAGIDAALLRLVRDIVPVPRVLDVRTTPTDQLPAYLMTERLPGQRLDLALPGASAEVRRHAGEDLGAILARLSAIPFLRGGQFVDDQLTIEPWPPAAGGLEAWVDAHRTVEYFAEWPAADLDALAEIARSGQDLLDDYVSRVCLVHSDVNPKNVLIEPESGAVTGLVDWEFAHSGTPYTDLGNLLRFETDEVFARAVLRAFTAQAPGIAPGRRSVQLARVADLFALVDLAARTTANPVVEQARALLATITRTGDVAAGRPEWR